MGMFTRSIAAKLTLGFGAALAVTVVLLTAIGTINVRHQALDAFELSSHSRINQADNSLDETFQGVEQNLSYLASTTQLQAADDSLANYLSHGGQMTPESNSDVEKAIFALLKHFGDTHPSLRYLDIGTHWGGYVQWPIEAMNSDHYDPRARPWYELAMTAPDHVVRPAPYQSAAGDGGAVIPFARVVKDAKGETIGVLEADISLSGFANLTKSIRFGDTGYLLVADGSGKVLIDPRDKTHEFKALDSIGDGYHALATSADGAVEADLGAVRYQGYVYTSPKNGWRYFALVPRSEMMAAANRLTLLLIATGMAVLVVGLAITITMGRRITAPLRSLASSMKEIATGDGDMTRRLPQAGDDEVGVLAHEFNGFVEKLRGVLVSVKASSGLLERASSEVSSGNRDLSARTEQQAASLEETAASMEEFAGTVRQTADQAHSANTVTNSAVEIARRGNEAVSTAATTMATVVAQSTRIEGIVGLIEGIAFQTNILALNAAVESARAGEEGRGFAVVAGEVRNLARRSADAAKDIKKLLGESVVSVRSGASQVDVAGKTIAELTAAISNVAAITSEIAAAAREQSQSIDQVNQAVSQMDDATQQNAALVEQMAAASESLKSQGHNLYETISSFKLD